MTEKFTPGEWHSGIDAEDKRPYIFCGDSPQEIIADVFVPNQCIEQAIANAALIAAAPEMYKELCELEHVLRGVVARCVPGSGQAYFLWACIDKIIALRKKARGEK